MVTAKRIGIGCGVAVVAFIALIVVVFVVVRMLTAGPEQVVRDFLTAAAAGDYAKAHDSFAAPLKEQQPLDRFRKTVEGAPSLFAVSDMTFTDRSIDTNGAKLSGSVTLKTGTHMPASFQLVKEGDAWKLIAYHIGAEP